MHEVFEHSQGKVLGRVCQARSGTGPAATEPVAAFSIQRGFRKRPPENSVNRRHGRLTDSTVGDAAKDVLDGACAGLGVHQFNGSLATEGRVRALQPAVGGWNVSKVMLR